MILECGPHESYFPCGNLCEPTCFKGDGAICIRLCGDPACGCVNGFYRSLSGDCVRYEECLKSNDNFIKLTGFGFQLFTLNKY